MKTNRNFLIWALIFLGVFLAMSVGGAGGQRASQEKLAFSDFMTEAENKRIAEITVSGPDVYGKMIDGTSIYT